MKGVKRMLVIVCSVVTLACGAAAALAGSTPIGPLPAGPTSNIDVQHGELVAVAVPQRSSGRIWRIARRFDPKVLRQVSEGNVGSLVVLVFRAGSAGRTTVSLALTKSDTSAKAFESRPTMEM